MVRSAIALDPEAPAPHTNLGRMLVRKIGMAEEALKHHDLCLAKLPNYADAHNNRAAALYVLSRLSEAEQECRKALALKPTLADAHSNLGNILHRRGDTEFAIRSYDRALELAPDLAEARLNRSLALLTLGRFAEGWRDFEARWQCRGYRAIDRGLGLPRLGPDDQSPGTVLIWGEQGIGDEIVYGSMAPDLTRRGFDVILECDPRLVALWQRSQPALTIVGRDQDVANLAKARRAKWQIPIASLGGLTRRTIADFPLKAGFLTVDPQRRASFRGMIGAPGDIIVGLSWMSVTDETGRAKSIALERWLDLFHLPGVIVVNLQYGDTSREIDALRAAHNAKIRTIPNLDLRNDLDGLAALIGACDIVIGVSNATAHLAGAVGVSTIVLAPAGLGRFWYWQNAAATTPLYPSVRILRQSAAGDWSEAVATATERVAEMARTQTGAK
ncbi:MAG: tetratricopeptide repeat protein [Alphaproteobacteria bacterium]|nr:tetratricopeptide repeat protein [Alphaproteobacteria bacterium]